MVQCDTTADNTQFIEEASQRCAPAPASHRHRVKPSARTFSGRSGLPFPSDYFVSSQFPIVGWLSAWMHSRVSASKSNVRTAGRWGAVRPRRCPAVSPSLGHQGFAASVLRSEVVRAEGDSVARRALSDSIAAPPGEYALLLWNNELAAVAAAHRVDPDRVVGLDRRGGEVRLERPADALGKAVAASEIGGGWLVVVDAIDDEAPSFYEHYHFVPVRNRERRLVMKVSTAAKALGERWRD